MARRVTLYFSTISPWAHLSFEPFMALVKAHDLRVDWKPLPLNALFAETGGLPLAKRAIERQRYRMIELKRWSAKRGRPMNLKPKHWPFDASLADRAALALIARGADPAGFVGDVMRGVWEEERDLAAPDTLIRLLGANGFDGSAVLAEAATPEIAAVYEANRREGQEIGVFGAPTFVLDGEPFWGQDRIDLLEEALVSGRAPYDAGF